MDPVISLTTIPSRIEYIEPCIASLLRQGLPVYLWVQKEVKRTRTALRTLPAFLENVPGLTTTVVSERGPITKLLPAFEAGFETVITADDDHTYGRGWAAGLLSHAKRNPDAAICYRGRIFGEDRRYNKSTVIFDELRLVDFITGVKGALYRRTFFADSIFTEWREWMRNDDIVTSTHLMRRGVPMLAVPLPKGCRLVTLDTAHIDPLYIDNVKHKMNDEGLLKLYWR